ncbi:MAG: histidinol dehydrogenase [Candidatus Riflebacteria bacterium]|nr:histidinol dehydrogenase [Candidatus Riflebacteria bacterium]
MATVDPRVVQTVEDILAQVRSRGDKALLAYARKLDRVSLKPGQLRVTTEEIDRAYSLVDLEFMKALELARASIERFHQSQLERSWMMTDDEGVFLGLKVFPIASVGAYVPGGAGGKRPLVSTALMCTIPARIAGCRRIVVASPPRAEGTLDPHLLVALAELDVDEIYKIGGAQAIGALAYGTESVRPVDKIVGPGNMYVAMAKLAVSGAVATDGLAGPSEIVVLADASARADFIAADMIAQAEHDADAIAVLVTVDGPLAHAVAAELSRQVGGLDREAVIKKSLATLGSILLLESLDEAVDVVNRIAPENLEIHTADPQAVLNRIRTAGAIHVGPWTPQVLGDYVAGPNHTLPTCGTARYGSPLGVWDFLKRTAVVTYTRDSLAGVARAVDTLAHVEGLEAHARSLAIRFDGPDRSGAAEPARAEGQARRPRRRPRRRAA